MGEYISRDAVHGALRKSMPTIGQLGQINAILSMTLAGVAVDVNAIPAADVVPVVRCKDCIHWGHDHDEGRWCWCSSLDIGTAPDSYCQNGARMDKGEGA